MAGEGTAEELQHNHLRVLCAAVVSQQPEHSSNVTKNFLL